MDKLKLPENKHDKPSQDNSSAKSVRQKIRPVDPSKRSRSVSAFSSGKLESKLTNNGQKTIESNKVTDQKSGKDKPSQRNHRFDGKLHSDELTEMDSRRNERGRGSQSHHSPTKTNKVSVIQSFKEDEIKNPRLSKRMSELGLCSRREADEWIVNGWVKVNGETVSILGSRVDVNDVIEVTDEAHKHQSETVTFLLNKPIGYVSGQAEDDYEPAVVLINPDNRWQEDQAALEFKRGHLKGLAPAGRLDIDSTGLLVLTQDGRIAKHLIGEDSSVEKEYLVRVEGSLSEEGLKKLNFGLELDGQALKPAKVSWQNEDQLRFVLREGKKRQIRRMCELVGLKVLGLKRIRIGQVSLGKLPVGTWRYLNKGERF